MSGLHLRASGVHSKELRETTRGGLVVSNSAEQWRACVSLLLRSTNKDRLKEIVLIFPNANQNQLRVFFEWKNAC